MQTNFKKNISKYICIFTFSIVIIIDCYHQLIIYYYGSYIYLFINVFIYDFLFAQLLKHNTYHIKVGEAFYFIFLHYNRFCNIFSTMNTISCSS